MFPATPKPPVTTNAPVVVEVLAVLFVMLVIPVADSVLKAPVLTVVAPIAVEFRPVEVIFARVPSAPELSNVAKTNSPETIDPVTAATLPKMCAALSYAVPSYP